MLKDKDIGERSEREARWCDRLLANEIELEADSARSGATSAIVFNNLRVSREASVYFGYYERMTDSVPQYDPFLDAPCPRCGRAMVDGPATTFSFTMEPTSLSLFYRMHTDCYKAMSAVEFAHLECRLMALLLV